MFRKTYNKAALWGLILSGVLFACGPSFPNSYLANSDTPLLSAPRFSFENEIKRIPLEQETTFRAVHRPAHIHNPRNHVLLIDIQDLQEALEERGDSSDAIKTLVEEYQTVRMALERYNNERDSYYRSPSKGGHVGPEPVATFSVDQISESTPEEFRLYLQGVMFLRASKVDKAVKAWEQLLALPEEQRHYRSTWAGYMIAKCSRTSNKEKARFMSRQVRQYVRDGFADSLGLAAASYGDEAGIYLSEDQYEKAIELYLIQTLTGDSTAVSSLKYVCYSIFNKHKDLDMTQLVNNRMVREIMLAYAITQGSEKYNAFVSEGEQKRKYSTSQQILLDAIEQAGLDDVKNADRFAAIAYRDGGFERARRWLEIADIDSPISRRIRAKLLLRDGNIKEAAENLAFIARQTNPDYLRIYGDRNKLDNSHKLHSELGSLYVSQKMYIQAVDALMRGGNWIDAAYIAERVLSPEELQGYVDTKWPSSMLEPINDEDGFGPEGEKAMKIRWLLARRLSRHGQFQQARAYYPNTQKELLDDFDTFTNALERANDGALSQDDRADGFWTAAWISRHKGMELFGFELSPDWTMLGGNFSLKDPLEYRKKYLKTEINSKVDVFEVASKPYADKHQLNRASPDEIERAGREIAIPDKRFHYRYMASDFAWEAAALMQNEDEELARRLCLAGSWTKDRDPQHADVFYKSLVLRCGTTDLGKEADKLRWFPKIPNTLKAKTKVDSE